jgi:hypothetical protein
MSTRAVFAHNIGRFLTAEICFPRRYHCCVRKLLRHDNIWERHSLPTLLPACQNHSKDPEANRVLHFVDFANVSAGALSAWLAPLLRLSENSVSALEK